jgi:hypothetical protein
MAREPLPGHLGAFNAGPDYTGDFIAAGVDRIVYWLSDVESDEDLEIHLSIGSPGNLWLYTIGHAPPEGRWARFEVDLADSASFTQIQNDLGGSYTLSLRQAERVHWRHDRPPFERSPDPIAAQVGLDKIVLTNAANAVADLEAPRPSLLALAPARPNPAAPGTVIGAMLAEPARVRLTVLTVAGRAVRRSTPATSAPARISSRDGRDAGEVSAGIYLVALEGAQRSATGRIAVVR